MSKPRPNKASFYQRLMGHLHQWSLSLLLSWSLPCAFTSNSSFGIPRISLTVKYRRESKKGKTGVIGRGQVLERDDAHKKSPTKATWATHFCSDNLIDNAQQRSEALLLSTTLATTPESSEPLSLAAFSKKKRCRCYM